tara:strand:- start:1533 stop:2156 length:624 start_codon:yes stop_codon:yes gene_type:complete
MTEEFQVQPFDSIFHDSATINEAFTTDLIKIVKDEDIGTNNDVTDHIFFQMGNNMKDAVQDTTSEQVTDKVTEQITDQASVGEDAPVDKPPIEDQLSNIDTLPDQKNNNDQSIHDLIAKKNKEEESNDIENLQNKFNFLHGLVNNLDNSINEIKDQLHTLTSSKNSNILGNLNLSFCDNNILILICILIVITIIVTQSKKRVYSILL